MDQLEESNQTPQEFRTPPNFRVIMNINQLVEMATIADTVGKKAREAREQAAAPKPRQNLKIQHPLSSSTLLRVVPAKVATAAIAVVTRVEPIRLVVVSVEARFSAKLWPKAMTVSRLTHA